MPRVRKALVAESRSRNICSSATFSPAGVFDGETSRNGCLPLSAVPRYPVMDLLCAVAHRRNMNLVRDSARLPRRSRVSPSLTAPSPNRAAMRWQRSRGQSSPEHVYGILTAPMLAGAGFVRTKHGPKENHARRLRRNTPETRIAQPSPRISGLPSDLNPQYSRVAIGLREFFSARDHSSSQHSDQFG